MDRTASIISVNLCLFGGQIWRDLRVVTELTAEFRKQRLSEPAASLGYDDQIMLGGIAPNFSIRSSAKLQTRAVLSMDAVTK